MLTLRTINPRERVLMNNNKLHLLKRDGQNKLLVILMPNVNVK